MLIVNDFSKLFNLVLIGILEEYLPVTPDMKERRAVVNKKYRAIEIDPTMTIEEKIPFMLEWYVLISTFSTSFTLFSLSNRTPTNSYLIFTRVTS